MKAIIRIPMLLLGAIILILLAGCGPVINTSDGLIIGDSYHLNSGQTLNHDLTVVGGSVILEQDSTVNGDVAVVGGNVTIDGKINGDLTTIGGNVNLDNHANILGQLNSLGGQVERSSQAVVEGKTQDNGRNFGPITTIQTPLSRMNLDPITRPLMAIFQALALAALAVVVNLFAPVPMERTGRAAIAVPVATGGVGCLTIIVLMVMTITIILIPISVLGFILAGIATLFGWLALGLFLGRQLSLWLKQPWTDPVSAGLGTLVLSLLTSMLNIIPCIGWTAGALVGLVGLGAVVLTRFGTQIYPTPFSSAPTPYSGPYTPPPPYRPTPQPGAQVYGPESDQPRANPPAGPDQTPL